MEFTTDELEKFAKGTEVFMAILNVDGVFKKANIRWSQKFNRPIDRFIGESIYELIYEIEIGEFEILMNQVVEEGQLCNKMVTMIDDSLVTYTFQVDLTYDANDIYLVGFDVTDHAQEHRSLSEMSRMTKTGSWCYDPIRDKIIWSDEMYKIHNVPAGTEIKSDEAISFFLPEYRVKINSLIERLYKEHEPYDFSGMISTTNGEHKWVRTIGKPVVQNDEIIYISGVMADQTILHKSMETLQWEAETRKLALKGIKSGLFDHDLTTNTVFYSPDFKKMIGLSDENVLPEKEFRKLIHPEDIDGATIRYVTQLKSSVNYYTNHYRIKHVGEGYQHYEVYAWCKKNSSGRIVRMVGNLINVNDRVELEKEKDRIKNSLEAMVDNGFIFSMLLDEEGVILMADEETLGIIKHDYSVNPLTQKVKYVDVMPDIFKPTFLCEFEKALNGEIVRKEVERPLLEGSMQWLDVMYHPIKNKEGKVTQVLTNLMDVTKRKTAEISLTESRNHTRALSRLKSGILSNMSHEMRTPLNGIMGVSALLRQKSLDKESRELLQMQKQSEERLLSVLNDLVTLSDLDAMRLRMKLKQYSINQLARTCFDMYNHQAKMKKLDFTIEESAVEGVILVDHEMMIAALSAVVNNALKYTNVGFVKIICHVDEQEWGQLQIIDTGIGISENDFDRIFENFEIANIGMNMKYEGSGIGLSISKKIIQLMGGSIEVASELGKGSEFRIRLPALSSLDPE